MADRSRILTMAQAIHEATDLSLGNDTRVYLLGEGVTDPKAIFGTTAGLVEKYGADRVIEMPVAENGLTGVAIGSALMGQRPLMVHQRVEFALLAMEQIVNSAAKQHYLSMGRHRVALVIRMIIGRGWGQGPQHSQSLEAMFAQIPGLKVVMPTTPHDAKGLLIAAVEDDNPVIILEHRWLHNIRGQVPEGRYTVPLEGSRLVREGTDVTVVATSFAVLEAMRAADALAEAGCSAEVIDLRTLRPLDLGQVRDSVAKTGRLLIVDTGHRTFGIGAEIAATITETGFSDLKGPPLRLGLPDHPAPSTRALAEAFYPRPESILETVAGMIPLDGPVRGKAEKTLAEILKGRLVDVPDADFTGPF
jgi:pyruvate dehydrogenase E1 component beta subunit